MRWTAVVALALAAASANAPEGPTTPPATTTAPATPTTTPPPLLSLDGGPSDAGSPDAGPPAPPPEPPGLTPARLADIQAALQAARIDAWLLTDFRGMDPIAPRVLRLDKEPGSRRWFCLIPARGQPQKLVHAIEPDALDGVPGPTALYGAWRARDRELGRILRGARTVAMQYSARAELPMASRVDAGTVELVRSLGVEIASSAGLVAQLESVLTPDELASQARASERVAAALEATAQEAARRVRAGAPASERELQEYALARFAQDGLTTDGGRAIVAADAHSAVPHYAPEATGSALVGKGSVLLLDFAARMAGSPRAIYADLTRVYFLGERTPDEVGRIAQIVFRARDAALQLLRFRAEWSKAVGGAEVDGAARKVIAEAGFAERFLHRTGHSLGVRAHGDGVNNDDFETRDARPHLANTCFSVEPGIYLTGRFGVRSEIDVCLVKDATGKLAVDVRGGEPQKSVPALLAP